MTAESKQSSLVNENVVLPTGRTSIRFELEIWDALAEISRRENLSVDDIVARIGVQRDRGSRTSAVRVWVLRYFREAATEAGHAAMGHGQLPMRPAA
jgi:predicted DNA-binding ribbon-helix-helix protein